MGLFIVGAGGGCFSEAGFDHGSSGLRGFFTFEIARRWRSESEPYFKPSHFPRARVEPLLPHSRHRQAPALPYFPSICGHSDFPSLWNQYFPSRAYYGSSCFLAVQLIFGNFLDFEFFRILANVTKLSFSFFFFKFWPVWDMDRERAAIGTVLLLLRRKFWQKPALEVFLNWTRFLLGLEEINWIYISAAASCLPRFSTEYNTRLTGYSTLICS